jgi:hypothetical protein
MFKQLRYVYTRGGGRGGQPPDQLLISYILCDSSFQPNEGVRIYVLKIMILLLLFLGVLCIVYCVAEPVMLLQRGGEGGVTGWESYFMTLKTGS